MAGSRGSSGSMATDAVYRHKGASKTQAGNGRRAAAEATVAHLRSVAASSLVDGCQSLRRDEWLRARHAELLERVREEAHPPAAPHAVVAQLRPVPADAHADRASGQRCTSCGCLAGDRRSRAHAWLRKDRLLSHCVAGEQRCSKLMRAWLDAASTRRRCARRGTGRRGGTSQPACAKSVAVRQQGGGPETVLSHVHNHDAHYNSRIFSWIRLLRTFFMAGHAIPV